jgi:hypothetical protein
MKRLSERVVLAGAALWWGAACGANPSPGEALQADLEPSDRETAAFLAETGAGRTIDERMPPQRTARFQGLALRAEAWPHLERGHPDLLLDDVAGGEPLLVDAEMRPPWSFIFRVTDGVPEVAAVGIAAVDGASGPKDVTILTYPTSVPLTRASFRSFIEGAQRVGIGVVQRQGEFTIFRFDEPVRAGYVWVRVTSTTGGDPLALSEIAAYAPEHVAAFEDRLPSWVRLVPLHAVDTTPWQGINLVGLPDLRDGQPPQAVDQGAEGVLEQVGPNGSRPLEDTTEDGAQDVPTGDPDPDTPGELPRTTPDPETPGSDPP